MRISSFKSSDELVGVSFYFHPKMSEIVLDCCRNFFYINTKHQLDTTQDIVYNEGRIGRKAEYIMKCPYCGNPDTRVIDSRPAEDNNSIRRRRSCDECGKRFTTYEKVETIPLIVIKKDNNREQYDRSKIENGVLSACYKRPVPASEIQKTIDAIELEIFNREEKEIPSREIGQIVMDKLMTLDPVAYVRFASVYREFKDVNTFMSELKKFLE